MFQSKKKNVFIGLTVMLFLIATVFYTAAGAQPINADNVIKMVNEWKGRKLEYGQWIHMVSALTSETSNGVILPNGQPMPSSYTTDDWFYINKDGLAEKGVSSLKDNDGNVFQQAAFQNNISINFTFGERQENQQPSPVSIDLGFENQIKDAKNKGVSIKKSEEDIKGKPSIAFSYDEKLKLPTQFDNEDVIVDSITTKGNFDKETGDFVQIQSIWTLDNGTEVVHDSTEIISIDGFTDAPDEILKLLETVK